MPPGRLERVYLYLYLCTAVLPGRAPRDTQINNMGPPFQVELQRSVTFVIENSQSKTLKLELIYYPEVALIICMAYMYIGTIQDNDPQSRTSALRSVSLAPSQPSPPAACCVTLAWQSPAIHKYVHWCRIYFTTMS